jgi:hypothetical protein
LRNTGLGVSKLYSQSKGCGLESNILDGNGVKAMPGLIAAPDSCSIKKFRKIKIAKWGTNKYF